jgi:hypothetical protein
MNIQQRTVETDYIARLAAAWDGTGRHVLQPFKEHCALLCLAGLPETRSQVRWSQLDPGERHRLIFAARAALDFADTCSWVLSQ